MLRATPADGDPPSSRSPAPGLPEQPGADDFPVPPDWSLTDPAENRRRVLAMLEQGERDIAAGRGHELDEVLAELDVT
ncbi:MAG: hypothetical protein U1A78_38545 [Polyangia bacterium]